MNISDEIKRLHELHQAGALSSEEFEKAKAKLLNASVDLNKPSSGGGSGSDFGREVSRLRRSRTDRWLGGVCGGLAKVSDLESWVWRLVFALGLSLGGASIPIYVLMWIFVPEE